MFQPIATIRLLADEGSAPPPHQPAAGAFALLLLVVAVLALLLVITVIIMMNHRRRAARARAGEPGDGAAVDPWTLAGQRLNPDSPPADRDT